MPLYEYQCLPEHHRFEVRHGINEPAIETCPQCGGEVRRVIHPVGIVFKGTGFYATDSKKSTSATKSAESKPAEKSTSGESKAESKSDTKSASPAAD